MIKFLLILILFFCLLFEGTVTTLPLVLIYLLLLIIVKRDAQVFAIAFLSGLLLDLFTVHAIGLSSLFFVSFIFLILLYQGKYEIYSYPFVAAAAFFGSLGFLLLFGYEGVFLQSLLSTLLALIVFAIIKKFSARIHI